MVNADDQEFYRHHHHHRRRRAHLHTSYETDARRRHRQGAEYGKFVGRSLQRGLLQAQAAVATYQYSTILGRGPAKVDVITGHRRPPTVRAGTRSAPSPPPGVSPKQCQAIIYSGLNDSTKDSDVDWLRLAEPVPTWRSSFPAMGTRVDIIGWGGNGMAIVNAIVEVVAHTGTQWSVFGFLPGVAAQCCYCVGWVR